MAITAPVQATERPRMSSLRRTAFVAGLFYVITFVSIPVLGLYSVVHDPNYIVRPGPDTGVIWGVVLELIVAVAGIGTAITLFPVVKRQNESFALGFVATRTLEAAIIFVGATSLLTLVNLHQGVVGAAGPSAIPTGHALVGLYDGTFLLGQGLMPVANAVLLGYLMYRSGLVPRVIPVIGLIGAPLLLASKVATIFGVTDSLSAWSAILTVPVAAWELSLGLWLLIKGFRPCQITAEIEAARSTNAVTA